MPGVNRARCTPFFGGGAEGFRNDAGGVCTRVGAVAVGGSTTSLTARSSGGAARRHRVGATEDGSASAGRAGRADGAFAGGRDGSRRLLRSGSAGSPAGVRGWRERSGRGR